jgi:hypothetical protein
MSLIDHSEFGLSPMGSGGLKFGWSALVLLSALTASVPSLAQQKTGPGITSDDALTWHGITLYGVIDIGLQYDTHGAPFTDYRGFLVTFTSIGAGALGA